MHNQTLVKTDVFSKLSSLRLMTVLMIASLLTAVVPAPNSSVKITATVNEGILRSTRYGNALGFKETEERASKAAAVGLVAVRYGLEIDPSQLTKNPVRKPEPPVRVSTVVEGFEGGYVRMRGGRGRQHVRPPDKQDDDLNP